MRANIYIAGRYSRRDEFRFVAKRLRDAGHHVTSGWLYETEPLNSKMGDHSEDFYKETARIDLADIDRSEVVLFFSEDPLVGTPRGGRHVEFGYAISKFKFIAVVGPKENIFHYCSTVAHFDNVEDFIAYAAD